MSRIRERLHEAVAGARQDVRAVTGAVFWTTAGSIITLYAAAPEAALTKQILPLEIGLLLGMALGYLSYRED